MFHILGRIVTKYWPGFLVAWAITLGLVSWLAPAWDNVVLDREFAYMPENAPSRRGEEAFQQFFPDLYNPSTLALILYRPEGKLTREDLKFVEHSLQPGLNFLAGREGTIEAEGPGDTTVTRPVVARIHTFKEPGAGALLISEDGKATLVVLQLSSELLEQRTWSTVNKVDQLLDHLQKEGKVPTGLQIAQSGNARIGSDITEALRRSSAITEYFTLLSVVVLLLLIYRSPLLILVPLTTMFVAVQIVLKLLAIAASAGFITLFQGMQVYIIIIMYGTGVDYCLFLLSRYKEELDHGSDWRDAVAWSIEKTGVALTASAATVAIGIGMMAFAQFGQYHYAGISIFLSILVGWWASLTLTPSLLRLLGKRAMRATPSSIHSEHSTIWDKLAGFLQRRPGTILLARFLWAKNS